MASEFAESICDTYFQNSEGALLRTVIDAELQEVREVMDGLRNADGCWCNDVQSSEAHSEDCQRARTLMEKLRI